MYKPQALALLCILPILMTAAPAAAEDIYIRSEDGTGRFNGSHLLLTKPKTGYQEVTYCNRPFWVRKLTVLWTEREAAAGRKLFIEEDRGNNRQVLCSDPDKQVTLDDMGLKDAELKSLRARSEPLNMQQNRMNVISEAFKGYKK